MLHNNYSDQAGDPYDYTSMDIYEQDPPYDDYDQAGVMAYSPSASPLMDATSPHGSKMPSSFEISAPHSPVIPATTRYNDTSAYGLGISTPSGLPPQVDFVKLMQRASGTITEASADGGQHTKNIGSAGPKQSKAKTHRRRSQSANPIDRRGSNTGSQWEDEVRPPLRIPPRPRSALEARTVGAFHSQRDQGPDERQSTPKRSVLHGLPLRKPLAVPPAVTSLISTAEDNDDSGCFDDIQYPASQRATFPISQPASRSEETLGFALPAPSTPSRMNRSRLQDTETGSGPPSQVGTPSGGPSKTPSKRRRLAVVRAEAMAAESAKAVANIKAQSRMPLYHLMSIARLRLAATTFGLKPASKTQLVQQLTALWTSLNPTPPQDAESARSGNGNQGSGLSPSGIAAGADDGLFDEDEDMEEFGISHSQSLRKALGDRSDDNDAELTDGGIGYSGTQVLELDSDCSPIVSDAEDLAAGEKEDDDDEDDEGEDEEEDDAMAAARTGLGIDFGPSQDEGSGTTTPTLECQLYEFLNTTAHLRKQILTYKVSKTSTASCCGNGTLCTNV